MARAFYDDVSMNGENNGIIVVVIDSLTRHQWVREEDLANSLKLDSRQLQKALYFLEEEKLVTRDHKKETAKGAKIFNAAVAAATADSNEIVREGDDKLKLHSYCSLDYPQIYDVVRFKINKMKKKLKDDLDGRNPIQEYICPECKKRYSSLDVLHLISANGEIFVCEWCNNELFAQNDKQGAREMLQKMETQLLPLTQQLDRVKDLVVPEFGSLQDWEARTRVTTWPYLQSFQAIKAKLEATQLQIASLDHTHVADREAWERANQLLDETKEDLNQVYKGMEANWSESFRKKRKSVNKKANARVAKLETEKQALAERVAKLETEKQALAERVAEFEVKEKASQDTCSWPRILFDF